MNNIASKLMTCFMYIRHLIRLRPDKEGALSTTRLDVSIIQLNEHLHKEINPMCIPAVTSQGMLL